MDTVILLLELFIFHKFSDVIQPVRHFCGLLLRCMLLMGVGVPSLLRSEGLGNLWCQITQVDATVLALGYLVLCC